ncbi:hypothetical protein BJ138DRAFT_1159342 [Hygrophoropsis aurantiaca]|uniref:Uncharacterized protein n=1 Tax=Hygrophoropsis aurantiaca TaxID=72124 RepID=A0ACB8A430_9AGAM|nr:hypothetical protein BJ138DRAFT_1159342 [Hygrophoropsis aurantiaca]
MPYISRRDGLQYHMLLRRISPRQRHYSVRPERAVELSMQQGARIADVLNQPYGDCTDYGWKQLCMLPRMLTPKSQRYNTVVKGTTPLDIPMSAPTLVMWEEISSFSPFRKEATHAAHFWLHVTAPYSSIALAHFLSSFCAMYSEHPERDIASRHVVRLGYRISRNGVTGTVLCHTDTLDPTKDLTLYGAQMNENIHINGRSFTMLSFPAECEYIRGQACIQRCMVSPSAIGFE